MFRVINQGEYENCIEFLKKDIFQNVYMYIDSVEYGFVKDNDIKTFVIEDNGEIKLIVYNYYNSIQLFGISECNDNDYKAVADYIVSEKISMLSGRIDIAAGIVKALPDSYKLFKGYILSVKSENACSFDFVESAGKADIKEISKMICSEFNIGGHYTPEALENQFIDRMDNHNCRHMIIRDGKKIAAHVATYAELSDVAVIGGLITLPEYRKKGYGNALMNILSNVLISEGKSPVLYCYKEELKNWYVKQGFEIVSNYAKIEYILD